MPSKGGYAVGVLVILATAIVGIVLIVIGATSVAKAFAFPRSVSSDGSIEITHTGNYIVYAIDVESSVEPVFKPTIQVTSPGGGSVFAGTYGVGRSTTRNGEVARAVATFHASVTGNYRVSSTELGSGQRLGVGDGKKVRAWPIVLGIFVGGLGFLLGLVLLIVTAARRHRAKPIPAFPTGAAWSSPATPPGYGTPGYGPPPGYGPQPGYGPPPGAVPPPGAGPNPASAPNPWNAPPPGAAPPPAAPPATPSAQEWWKSAPPGTGGGAAPSPPGPSGPSNDPDQSGWASPS